MPVAALVIDLQLPLSHSLKDKRVVVRHLLDTSRRRFNVAAAEHGHQDLTQRAELVFAAVANGFGHLDEVLQSVEAFVWSHPELTVLSSSRHVIELDD